MTRSVRVQGVTEIGVGWMSTDWIIPAVRKRRGGPPRLRAETQQLPVWMEPNESNRYEDNCFDGSGAKKRDSNGAGRREQNTEKENDRKERSQQNSQR